MLLQPPTRALDRSEGRKSPPLHTTTTPEHRVCSLRQIPCFFYVCFFTLIRTKLPRTVSHRGILPKHQLAALETDVPRGEINTSSPQGWVGMLQSRTQTGADLTSFSYSMTPQSCQTPNRAAWMHCGHIPPSVAVGERGQLRSKAIISILP